MNSGRKLNVQQNADGKWQVELDPGHWHTCHSQNDADLIASAVPLMFASNPSQGLLRQILETMERNRITAAARIYRGLQGKLKEESGW